MAFKIVRGVLSGCCLFGVVCSGAGCGAEVSERAEVGKLSRSLEDGCAEVVADVTGDFLAVLSSTEALDPAVPQAYGSDACGGVVFEFDNPEEEPLHGAWVQASGVSLEEGDVLSEGRCPERVLQADYWGYKDRTWTKLAAAEEGASFAADPELGGGNCELDALMLQEGAFERLRIVARVTQESQTYPMHACVW